MKILFVLQGILKGGAERLTLDIAQEIKRNHKNVLVKIVALDNRNEYPNLIEGLDVHFIDSFVSLSLTKKSFFRIEAFEKIVDDFKPDVIHSHTYKSELVSRENQRTGVKYFTHVHSDFSEFDKLFFSSVLSKKQITNFYERCRMFNKYKQINNRFITISHSINNHLLNQLPNSLKKNVTLLYNAIDFKKFNIPLIQHNIQNNLSLVSIGRLLPHKNQIFLVAVLKQLHQKGFKFHLSLAGVGTEKEKIECLAAKNGLSEYISFLGLVDDVENIMAKSFIYVHSATYEPFGLVLIEAMAAGLPVVCLDGGGNRDIIEQNKNGIMVYEQNAELFAEAILKIATNEALYQQMSAYAVEYASRFDIKPYTDKLLALYMS